MKFSVSALVLALAGSSIAAPTPTINLEDRATIEKRAAISDVATLGYATLNGGTTGGSGGTTTTVSTLAQYTAAVQGDAKKVVVISGTITGAAQVRPGSNTSIIGKNSSASKPIYRIIV
jgi:pectate lyase